MWPAVGWWVGHLPDQVSVTVWGQPWGQTSHVFHRSDLYFTDQTSPISQIGVHVSQIRLHIFHRLEFTDQSSHISQIGVHIFHRSDHVFHLSHFTYFIDQTSHSSKITPTFNRSEFTYFTDHTYISQIRHGWLTWRLCMHVSGETSTLSKDLTEEQ